MRKISSLLLFVTFCFYAYSQTETPIKEIEKNFARSSFFLEVGANIPAFGWGSDYGYAKTGFEIGAGWDYYFLNKWGFGIDLRFHQNNLDRKENTISLKDSRYSQGYTVELNNGATTGVWNGKSIAIGPTYKTPLFNNKFELEAYIKGGIAMYKLPSLSDSYVITDTLTGTSYKTTIIDGYYHEKESGSDIKPFGIAGIRFGYNLSDNWMIYATVNYKTTLIDRDDYYYNYDRTVQFVGTNDTPFDGPIAEGVLIDGQMVDETAGYFGHEQESVTKNGSIQSFGALIGVKWTPSFVRQPKKRKQKIAPIKEVDTIIIVKVDTVKLKNTIINIKVKDGPSGVIIPNADVALIDKNGDVIMTAKSDAFGMVKFEGVEAGDYTTKAMVYGKSTTIESIKESDFEKSIITKTVLYEDLNFILIGKTINLDTKQPINEVLVSLDDITNKGTKQATSNQSGVFNFELLPESEYQVMGNKDGLLTNTNRVSTIGLKRSQTLFVELELGLQDPCGKKIKLNHIYYDLNKWFIRDEAKTELDRVVSFMKNNPNVKIELYSHTDCRASNKYNQTLSQKRATAAVNYIISQGVNPANIKGIGYGESKLLNKCSDGVECSEEEHQLNRRTEVKVICQ